MYIIFDKTIKRYLTSITSIMGLSCYNWSARKEDAEKMSKDKATKVIRMLENCEMVKVD